MRICYNNSIWKGYFLKDLINALQILLKYGDPYSPTHCEHDVLTIVGIDPNIVSEEDKQKLDDLGFYVSKEYGEDAFQSFRFGSA
jgi:hypothetical protein